MTNDDYDYQYLSFMLLNVHCHDLPFEHVDNRKRPKTNSTNKDFVCTPEVTWMDNHDIKLQGRTGTHVNRTYGSGGDDSYVFSSSSKNVVTEPSMHTYLFGKTIDNKSVCIDIVGYQPYIYIEFDLDGKSSINQSQTEKLEYFLRCVGGVNVSSLQMVTRKKSYGFIPEVVVCPEDDTKKMTRPKEFLLFKVRMYNQSSLRRFENLIKKFIEIDKHKTTTTTAAAAVVNSKNVDDNIGMFTPFQLRMKNILPFRVVGIHEGTLIDTSTKFIDDFKLTISGWVGVYINKGMIPYAIKQQQENEQQCCFCLVPTTTTTTTNNHQTFSLSTQESFCYCYVDSENNNNVIMEDGQRKDDSSTSVWWSTSIVSFIRHYCDNTNNVDETTKATEYLYNQTVPKVSRCQIEIVVNLTSDYQYFTDIESSNNDKYDVPNIQTTTMPFLFVPPPIIPVTKSSTTIPKERTIMNKCHCSHHHCLCTQEEVEVFIFNCSTTKAVFEHLMLSSDYNTRIECKDIAPLNVLSFDCEMYTPRISSFSGKRKFPHPALADDIISHISTAFYTVDSTTLGISMNDVVKTFVEKHVFMVLKPSNTNAALSSPPHLPHVLQDPECPQTLSEIKMHYFDNEREMLLGFRNFVVSQKCDVVTGYNISFDFHYLCERAMRYSLSSTLYPGNEGEFIRCRCQHDGRENNDNSNLLSETEVEQLLTNVDVFMNNYRCHQHTNNDDDAFKFVNVLNLSENQQKKGVQNSYFFYMSAKYVYQLTPLQSCSLNSSGLGDNSFFAMDLGNMTMDMYRYCKSSFKEDKYTLDFIVQRYLNDDSFLKKPMDYSLMMDLVENRDQKYSDEETHKVCFYVAMDALLPLLLFHKLMIAQNMTLMSRVTHTSMQDIVSRGQQIKVFRQLTMVAHEKGYIINNIPKDILGENDEDNLAGGYEGATVLEAVKGFHVHPVPTMDYAALYPSIMRTYNLCCSSYLPPKIIQSLVWNQQQHPHSIKTLEPKKLKKMIEGACPGLVVTVYKVSESRQHVFVDNVTGLMPFMLERLITARSRAKSMKKDALKRNDQFSAMIYECMQLAIKVSANSVYGFNGVNADATVYGCLPVAEITTFQGRNIIYKTMQLAIEYGPPGTKVLYGDTDSIMVKFPLQKTKLPSRWDDYDGIQMMLQEVQQIATKVAQKITDYFPGCLQLEFEGTKFPFFLKGKKMYAAFEYADYRQSLRNLDSQQRPAAKFKGLPTERRDTSPLVKGLLKQCLETLLTEWNISKVEMMIDDHLLNFTNFAKVYKSFAKQQQDSNHHKETTTENTLLELQTVVLNRYPQLKTRISDFILSQRMSAKYKSPWSMPQYVIQQAFERREPGSGPKPGDRVEWIVVSTKCKAFQRILNRERQLYPTNFIPIPDKKKVCTRVESPNFVVDNTMEIDFEYYLENKIEPVISIFDQFINLSSKIAKCKAKLQGNQVSIVKMFQRKHEQQESKKRKKEEMMVVGSSIKEQKKKVKQF